MRLRSHTLSPQHFAKVISYPTRQTHGSQRVKCSSSLVGGKKKQSQNQEQLLSRATGWISSLFSREGRTRGKGERVRVRVPGLIRMRFSCRILFRSHHVYTPRRKVAMENHLEFVKPCSRVKAVEQQLSARLSTRCSLPLPLLFPPLLIMHVDFKI